MVDIVTRLGKGSPLTNAEVDANFTNLAEVSGVTGEPMGHEDRTTSTISFNASTRTFTIAPVASSFTVWCKGKKVVVSTAQTVTIPNTTGMYSIYYDANGVLSAKSGYFTFSLEAPTAYVYWNAATGTAPYFGDERHGVVLDWQTHEYLHRTRGAALASGFSASGYVLGGNGSSNSHAQITLEGGTFFDEDMKIIVTATNTPTAGTWEQDLLSPARIPVLYLSGTGWVIDAPTDYPLKQGTARPQYNAYSGGVWSTADVANNKYATSWILATNNLTYPVIAIIGQAENDLQSAAEAVDFTALQLPGFPSVEFRPLYKLIFQCADSCTNAVHASLVSITDIRSIAAAGTAASIVTDHGNLSGLSDDDHPQYIHVDTLRTVSAAVKASFLPSQTSNAGKFLQTDGTATSWQSLTSGNVTTALGFTPYNATNPSGYISGISSSDVTTALGFTPYNATNPSGYVTAAGARGAISVTGAGSYDSATGVINIVGGVTSFNTRTGAITLSSADVTTALGFTPYNNTNPSGYITGITSTMVTTALGFTPYNSSNPNGYISSITSANVTTALGFTPYNATNPSGYITSSALSGYLTSASAASTYLPLSGGTLTGVTRIQGAGSANPTTADSTDTGILSLRATNALVRLTFGTRNTGNFAGWIQASYDNGGGNNGVEPLELNPLGGAVNANGNLVLNSGNYNSYALPLSGGTISGALTINGGSSYPLQVNSTQRYIAWFRNTSVAGAGWWLANDANTLVFHADSSGDKASLNTDGVFITTGSFRAPLFYDNNDTSYYVDPASTSVLNAVNWYGIQNWAGNGTYARGTPTYGYRFNNSADTINAFVINNSGDTTAYSSSRAPIFYDSNDTTYYLDPNSSTAAILAGSIGIGTTSPVNTAWGNASNSKQITVYGSAYGVLNIRGDSTTSTWYSMGAGDGRFYAAYDNIASVHRLVFYGSNMGVNAGSSPAYNLHVGGTGYATGDLRAPIFYDSDNTAFYVDPNSNSRLSSISVPAGSPGFVNAARGSYFGYSSGYGTLIYGVTSGAVTPCFNVDPISNVSGSFNGNGNEVMFRNGVQFISPNSSNNGYNNYFVLQDGYVAANNSLRAPIFYDTNDSSYYLDPAGSSLSASLNGPIVMASTGWTGEVSGKIQYHGSSWYLQASSYFHFRNTSGLNTFYGDPNGNTWSETSSRAPTFYDSQNTAYYTDPASATSGSFAGFVGIGNSYGSDDGGWGSRLNVGGGPHARIDVRCANDGIVTTMYSHAGQGVGKIGTYSNHPLALMAQGASVGGYVYSGSIRSPIFYDSDDTTYYVDPNSTGLALSSNGIVSSGGGTTGGFQNRVYVGGRNRIWSFGNADGYGVSYFQGGPDYIGLHVSGTPSQGGSDFWVSSQGVSQTSVSSRAPIFYDSNDTGYYTDPNGGSALKYLRVDGNWGSSPYGSGSETLTVTGSYASICQRSTISLQTYVLHHVDDRWSLYIGRGATNGSDWNWAIRAMPSQDGNYVEFRTSARAPIFYDYDNTGYYVDPNGSSYLHTLVLSGNSYFRPNNWIQMDSSAGIYWPNHYGAHLYPNTGSTYTQLQIDGQKNGYSGMHISHSGVQGMMYDGSGNGGVYREANGRWYWYYLLANDCMGIGTSSTNSAYGIYCNKGAYLGGRVDGTIFYDANNTTYYVDPNDTGTSVRVAGNVTAYYSDMRLKTHLGKIENALDKVKQLEGFYYEANETAQKLGYKPKREVGVSAQDVQAVLPEIVTDAPINSNYLTIDYERLTPLLIEAMKEQDQQVTDLRNRVAHLESLINKLIGD